MLRPPGLGLVGDPWGDRHIHSSDPLRLQSGGVAGKALVAELRGPQSQRCQPPWQGKDGITAALRETQAAANVEGTGMCFLFRSRLNSNPVL